MQYLDSLTSFQDEKYRIFLQNIIKEGLPVLGVRAHHIKAIAKEAPFTSLFKEIEQDTWHEMRMVRLHLLANTKIEEAKRIELIDSILSYVDSWAQVDSFVSALKHTKKEPELYFSFIQKQSKEEYSYRVRFALGMINSYFHDLNYLQKSFRIIENVRRDEKEIVMAKAWAIVTLFSHHPKRVLQWYLNAPIEAHVHKKVIQKARESHLIENVLVDEIKKKVLTSYL